MFDIYTSASSSEFDVDEAKDTQKKTNVKGMKRDHDELGGPQVPKKRRVVANGSAKRAHDWDDEPQVAKRRRMSSRLVQFSTPSMYFWLIEVGCRLAIVGTKKRHVSDERAHTKCTKRRRCHQEPVATSALSYEETQ
ncbi:hypothetical protein AC1031_015414 [Aphanomyces cochlioides]|nr:hypothetical protein AC1031_015414 [Aphanomyces cochlioides]